MSDWETLLEGRCAGEQVVVVKDSSLYYIMDISVVTRLTRHHSPSSRHYGIVSPVTRECDPAVVIGPGSRVTMNTVARVPNCKLTWTGAARTPLPELDKFYLLNNIL